MTLIAMLFGIFLGIFIGQGFISPYLYTRKALRLLEAYKHAHITEPVSYECGYTRALEDMVEGFDMTEDRGKEVPR